MGRINHALKNRKLHALPPIFTMTGNFAQTALSSRILCIYIVAYQHKHDVTESQRVGKRPDRHAGIGRANAPDNDI
ncbi:MAG: hypothetical protein PHW09_08535, partial [Desulfovibrio desulfuricans]|nr:hypothetical protein [Desulfovibrio desulfuricans]